MNSNFFSYIISVLSCNYISIESHKVVITIIKLITSSLFYRLFVVLIYRHQNLRNNDRMALFAKSKDSYKPVEQRAFVHDKDVRMWAGTFVGHYIVLYDYDCEAQSFICMDPASWSKQPRSEPSSVIDRARQVVIDSISTLSAP